MSSRLTLDPDLPEVDDLLSLFLQDTPLLDVRAPVEFEEGAFPNTLNRPLIDNEERHRIGKTYKDLGQDAAIELGLTLVSGDKKQQRVQAWREFAQAHPNGVLYCFRGGLRSKTAQQWLHETGIDLPRVKGGYKAMRRFLIDQLEANAQRMRPVVLGGRTGVGKTRFLRRCTPHLDLEGLAWHRGSAFGRHATPQPPQVTFENTLSIQLLRLVQGGNPHFVAEDESRNIGARHIPMPFFEHFSQAPVVVLEAGLDERIEVTLQEYVHDALGEYRELYGDTEGFSRWAEYLQGSLDRIQRRLGGDRHQRISHTLREALHRHEQAGDSEAHREWIRQLLVNYYDSMYEYQLEKKKDRICFSGDHHAVSEFLHSEYDIGVAPNFDIE
ncbi:MAG: tRNA 2-selenouridine(34) synthase MnmH [Gammaproteobacteria bacterium]|nr:MAG: tRNA 2-selenouridine(34) synthase MnmH [Gammaproteobacteria bacterium]